MKLNNLPPQLTWDLSHEDRQNYLKKLLLEQINWVTRNVPFYEDLRLDLDSFDKMPLGEILLELPVINKQDIKNRNTDFLSKRELPGNWTKTGGSTGEPVEIFQDKEKIRRGKQSVAFGRGWWGLKNGQKCFYIWGHSASFVSGYKGFISKNLIPVKDFLRNRLRVNAYMMDQTSLSEYIRKILRYQPIMIIGYTSTVHMLAKRYNFEGYKPDDLRNMRGIIVTADPCYPYQKEEIQEIFGAPVILEYGSVEVGAVAYSHPDGTFRVLEDHFIIETLEDKSGLYKIVVTDLSSRFQPFIRYSMDDFCDNPIANVPGIGYRSIGNITGRRLDAIVGCNGELLHGVYLSHMVNIQYPEVLRYRFYQDIEGYITLEVQLSENSEKNINSENMIINNLAAELGHNIDVGIKYVEDFPQTPSGKFRWVVSEKYQSIM